MATKKYVSLEKLGLYDEKIKKYLADADTATLESAKTYAKDYADSLATNYDAAGAAATAKSEAIAAAAQDAADKVKTLAEGAVKTNTEAIAAIKDGTTLDSFADVESALAGKQAVGDYATKTEAQGYANAKDAAIKEAKDAADAAQSTADANAEAIAAINNTETGVLAQAKKFASDEDAKVQGSVDALAAKVGTVPEGSTVMGLITEIQENAYDDSDLQERVEGINGKVTTLIGSDENKSVRTIANEELAKQLIAEGAAEALNSLEEIAAWIQSHPDDAAAMNRAIEALQAKVVLGTYVDGEEEKEYATVKAYVEAAIAALNIGDYATAAALTELAGKVTTLETASATHALKTEVEAVSTALNEYKEAHAGDYTNAQVDAAIKVVSDAVAALDETYATDDELAAAVEAVKADSSNKDAVVLAEAQKASAAVQEALDTHTGNGDIHVTAEQKTQWSEAYTKRHEHENKSVLDGITAAKVQAWDGAEQAAKTYADGLNTAMNTRVEALETWHENFLECSEEDIANLFKVEA